jgi:heptosyltransferase-1
MKHRVLVVRVGAMGDVLHGLPAIAALRAAWPDAEIGWAIEPRWSFLLRASASAAPHTPAMPLVDRVHEVPTKMWSKRPLSLATLRSVLALRKELREQRYDIAIDLQGSVRSSVIAKMSGARIVVGSASPREAPARMLYTQTVGLHEQHVVAQAAEIVSTAVGSHVSPGPTPLPVDPQAELWCDTVLPKAAERRTVFLAPTAGWGAKEWPAEHYGVLAKELAHSGFRVLVNASPFGADAVAEIVVATSGHAAIAVACTLPQLTALLRRVDLVIAGDSGPLHLAAALETPTVALFGPTDPARTGPWSAAARVLRHAESVTDHRRHAATEAGLAKIEVSEVLAAARSLLGDEAPLR